MPGALWGGWPQWLGGGHPVPLQPMEEGSLGGLAQGSSTHRPGSRCPSLPQFPPPSAQIYSPRALRLAAFLSQNAMASKVGRETLDSSPPRLVTTEAEDPLGPPGPPGNGVRHEAFPENPAPMPRGPPGYLGTEALGSRPWSWEGGAKRGRGSGGRQGAVRVRGVRAARAPGRRVNGRESRVCAHAGRACGALGDAQCAEWPGQERAPGVRFPGVCVCKRGAGVRSARVCK